jgi:flagellar hook assembly protein FlgD
MIAQLAQFSSLEEMTDLNQQVTELNDNIVGLAVLQQTNALMAQLTSASALIGASVKFLDPETDAEAWGTVASVKIQDGQALLSIGGRDVPLASLVEIGPAPGSES